MAIVIGLVIHASHRTVFEEAARTLSGVRLEWVVYEHEDEIRPRVQELLGREQLSGLLLGQVPFAKSRDLLPADLSVTVTKSAGFDLSIAFFRALARGWRATPVSIDTFDPETVDEVAQALQLDRGQVACLPYNPERSVEEVVDFHRAFQERTGADYAISLRTAVTARLAGSVPVLNALYGPATIRANLHELALRIQSRQASASRFAAGVFLVVTQDAQADLDRARIGLMNLLVNTPEFSDAWIENRDRRGVVVFAHKALFEHVTHNWVSLPILGQAQEALGIRLAAGFGVGASARTCVQLAEWAASRAEQESAPSAYLVEDSGVIIGPMSGVASPLAFTYRDHGGDVEGLARRAGLSAATLSRLAALERSLEGRLISPSDLAASLGITDPSGRRLIRKLSESGLVTEEGSEQMHRKGRPTRLYRLGIGSALTGETSPS
ncbi:MarR family transcriptional regulator [Nonomuraea basaltis]|uniref:MarR family transcriptional regulator n=1 Tax=Nonomuraea basaltis TaxID=2495887 RepID=UPI00197E3049|nr:helix-turn-helix domain-containing protein [Nonomuraea basaltis]